ncbi:MAG TPA: PD-(D/E)XK nuclease family protein [Acidimicrobiales bacterium]|nr:PD-(D/E)XK nuclease family protein [Acidimicrobiales bacterium]
MGFPVPTTLSPSKIASFRDCGLAFRFSVIDRLPEPPSPAATRGTLVHRALERLFWEVPAGQRSPEAARAQLAAAWEELQSVPDFTGLGLSADEAQAFRSEAEQLLGRYFELEDPDRVNVVGVELMMEAEVGGVVLRGIIDRLELDAAGEFVVTDYKTGRAPNISHEQARLGGVQFYALLCEQVLGRRPSRVQLLYLNDPLAIVAVPSDQSIRALQSRTKAVWAAVVRACDTEDFRPRPGPLCDWCAFRAYCPAWGGDPGLAAYAGSTGEPAAVVVGTN